MASGFCYIMTNRPRGVLYVGVTSNLPRRAYEHRMGLLDGFTSRYGLTRLVHYEQYALIVDAIQREKTIKRWTRAWKIELVEKENPDWTDLYDQLF
jgi:putative endonuclease